MKKCLNICCGRLQKKSTADEEWINIDKADVKPSDLSIQFLQLDIQQGLPYETSAIDHIDAIACLGQIIGNDEFLFVMNELWRVLKSSGTIYIVLPHMDFPHAYLDPFNQRHFNELSWQCFDERHSQYINHNSYYGFKPWRGVDVKTNPNGFLEINMTVSK
mgnify:CR=1 FL=1